MRITFRIPLPRKFAKSCCEHYKWGMWILLKTFIFKLVELFEDELVD
jgi:hypothetical protein